MYLPYVYKLTDKTTGKWYIGSRISETDGCYPGELGVRYFTSSKIVAPLFRSEPDRFLIEIMVTSEDADYVLDVEKSMLEFRNAKYDPDSYNMHHNDGRMNTVKSGKMTLELGLGFHSWSFEQFSDHNKSNGYNSLASKKGVHARSKEQMSIDTSKANSHKWVCDECGMKSIAMGIGRHQKYSGHRGKTRLDN